MPGPAHNAAAWVAKAEEDRAVIRLLLVGPGTPWSAVSFHAQQAAEKYLKALLVAHLFDPEKTHDLEKLLVLGLKHAPALARLEEDCERLTAYAVDSRYPDLPAGDLETLAREAIAASARICDAVRASLPPLGNGR